MSAAAADTCRHISERYYRAAQALAGAREAAAALRGGLDSAREILPFAGAEQAHNLEGMLADLARKHHERCRELREIAQLLEGSAEPGGR